MEFAAEICGWGKCQRFADRVRLLPFARVRPAGVQTLSDPHVACEKHGPIIQLSGETPELKTAAAIDDAVIDIIMELNEASSEAKNSLRRQHARP